MGHRRWKIFFAITSPYKKLRSYLIDYIWYLQLRVFCKILLFLMFVFQQVQYILYIEFFESEKSKKMIQCWNFVLWTLLLWKNPKWTIFPFLNVVLYSLYSKKITKTSVLIWRDLVQQILTWKNRKKHLKPDFRKVKELEIQSLNWIYRGYMRGINSKDEKNLAKNFLLGEGVQWKWKVEKSPPPRNIYGHY